MSPTGAVRATMLGTGPVLSWTGPTNGALFMQTQGPVIFATPGTYTLRVSSVVTINFKGVGGGQKGASNSGDNGGNGGRGGMVTPGTVRQMLPNRNYELIVGAGGVGASLAAGISTRFTDLAVPFTHVRLVGGGSGDVGVGDGLVPTSGPGSGGINPGAGSATAGGNVPGGAASGGGGGWFDAPLPGGNPGAKGGDGINAGQAGIAGGVGNGGAGGNGGGASFAESPGNYGYGGGGAGGQGGGGQNGANGIAIFVFVSTP